ncbi:hypothetical protein GCM10023306_23690 [Novosphingobium ginsenosidimutans]
MAKRRRLGKSLSGLSFFLIEGRRAGQGIAIVKPPHQVAVLAAGRAERSMLSAAGLATEWTLADDGTGHACSA